MQKTSTNSFIFNKKLITISLLLFAMIAFAHNGTKALSELFIAACIAFKVGGAAIITGSVAGILFNRIRLLLSSDESVQIRLRVLEHASIERMIIPSMLVVCLSELILTANNIPFSLLTLIKS